MAFYGLLVGITAIFGMAIISWTAQYSNSMAQLGSFASLYANNEQIDGFSASLLEAQHGSSMGLNAIRANSYAAALADRMNFTSGNGDFVIATRTTPKISAIVIAH